VHKGGTNVNSGCICMRMCNICTFIAGIIDAKAVFHNSY